MVDLRLETINWSKLKITCYYHMIFSICMVNLDKNRGLELDIVNRINVGWAKWRKDSEVPCNVGNRFD